MYRTHRLMQRNTILPAAVLGVCLAGCGGGASSASRLSPKDFSRSQATTQDLAAPRPIKAMVQDPAPATQPATRPSRPAVVSMGSYMIVGTVIAEANGQAIYADRVLAKLDDVFTKKAKLLDSRTFRAYAMSMIHQQVDADIREELEFAAAQRFTTDEDQQIAATYTAIWRQKEITRNGGSYAVTCERYLHPTDPSMQGQGIDFDEKVKEQYRRHLVIIYYQRRVWPRVQVSADEMRRFFDRNKDEFTEKAGVLFRAIAINKLGSGSSALAMDKIEGLRAKAKAGENFGLLASQTNDNRAWKNTGGFLDVAEKKDRDGNVLMKHKDGRIILRDKDGYGVIKNPDGEVLEKSKELLQDCEPVREPQYIAKGSLKSEELEKAVFALSKPGELTGVIDGGDMLYIAQLEDRRAGREHAFEEEKVQHDIRQALETEQRLMLRVKEQQKLVKASVGRMDETMIDTAVEMAMQKYYIAQPAPTTRP
ncbi:MAG: peptidyl-prolyl cis-trans isomerase [Tepidisphaerales bacterium]